MTNEPNILITQINGPNLVTGQLAVITPTRVRTMQSAMLCRCGHSRDKPFCDGAHVKSGFRDPARLPAKVESEVVGTGSLTLAGDFGKAIAKPTYDRVDYNGLAMVDKLRVCGAELRGINRLTIDAIAGVVDVVEAMHTNIARVPILAKRQRDRTSGITRLVYQSIRGVVDFAGHRLDGLLAEFEPLLGERSIWPGREALLAALNGVLGDYLAASNNPLAITMCLRRGGIALPGERAPLAAAIPQAGGRWSCCCTDCA